MQHSQKAYHRKKRTETNVPQPRKGKYFYLFIAQKEQAKNREEKDPEFPLKRTSGIRSTLQSSSFSRYNLPWRRVSRKLENITHHKYFELRKETSNNLSSILNFLISYVSTYRSIWNTQQSMYFYLIKKKNQVSSQEKKKHKSKVLFALDSMCNFIVNRVLLLYERH